MSETPRRFYPLLLDLAGKRVLVVGGGEVAWRKVETLLEYGARVFVISKMLNKPLEELAREGKVEYLGISFREELLNGISLVIAATSDKALNHRVSESARKRGLLINAVDQPEDCDFIVPSIVKRGDLLIAISTSGKSPALAKKIRKTLENSFGPEYALFLAVMGRVRKAVLAEGFSQKENSLIFQEIVDSPLLDALSVRDWKRAAAILKGILPEGLLPDVSLEDFVAN